ncbi:MAG: TonB-dependent receptor [Pseudomonadota bacterium]
MNTLQAKQKKQHLRLGSGVVRAGLCGGVGVMAFILASQGAFAQDGVDTIVVTAQQRAQNVQEVPITISIVTNENITALAADNIGDIDSFVPGLSIGSGSPTQPRFRIRGIVTSDFGVGTDPAVGVYVDGVYAARTGASLLAFNDIERIEIIKGPQGTLFGRNSAAGAVSVTTNKPTYEVEARTNLRLGNFGKRRFEGLLNLPVTDNLAVRLNGVVNRRDGLFTDAETGEDLSRQSNWAMRAALKWEPTDATSVLFSFIHDEIDQDARPAIGIVDIPEFPAQPPTPPEPEACINPFTAPLRNDVVGNSETRNLDDLVLTINQAIGSVDFTSITGYRQFETNNREDEDGTNRRDLYFDTNNVEENESFYQEIRFAGQTGRFDWIVGASYFHENANQRSNTFTFTDTINTLIAPSQGPLLSLLQNFILDPQGIPINVLGLDWSEDMINEGNYDAYAVFTDVIWRVTDRLSITGGVRYTRDDKEFSWFNDRRQAPEFDAAAQELEDMGILAPLGASAADFNFDFIFDLEGTSVGTPITGIICDNGVAAGEGALCVLEDTFEDISPRIVVDYQVTDDVLVFASFAEGYKAGGYNSVEVASRFDNEDVRNYEIGFKSTFDTIGLLVNASAFYYTYNDRQAIRLVPDVGGSGVPQYLVETSDDEAFGIDFQSTWAPINSVNLFANAQYIDVTFKNRVTRGGLDLSGQPTGEPFWSVAVGGTLSHDMASAGSLELFVAHSYQGETRCNDESEVQGNCVEFPAFELGEAQNRTDLRLYWRSEDERVQLGAFVNNVFDNRYVGGINNLTADTLGTPFVTITEPRFWGFDIEYRY